MKTRKVKAWYIGFIAFIAWAVSLGWFPQGGNPPKSTDTVRIPKQTLIDMRTELLKTTYVRIEYRKSVQAAADIFAVLGLSVTDPDYKAILTVLNLSRQFEVIDLEDWEGTKRLIKKTETVVPLTSKEKDLMFLIDKTIRNKTLQGQN